MVFILDSVNVGMIIEEDLNNCNFFLSIGIWNGAAIVCKQDLTNSLHCTKDKVLHQRFLQ